VRGIRFSLTDPATAVVTLDMVEPLSKRVADLGWHVQFNVDGQQVVEWADLLRRLPAQTVFDHMGHPPLPAGIEHPSHRIIRGLIDRGRTWVKLSGAYSNTKVGPPYPEATKIAQAFVKAAPERMVWGSDWPHPSEPPDSKPNDAMLFDMLAEWAPEEATRHGILVENPVLLYGFAPSSGGLLVTVDHLVYATPALQVGVERVERLLGLRATPGGQHPGRGTRNALLSLGPGTYLEIIGPDPDQPIPAQPRPFGIDDLREPRLVTWAAKGKELEQLASEAGRRGVKLGEVISGNRQRGDGVVLSWRYTDPRTVVADGIVPFFIDWGKAPHPARTATEGASLIGLRAEHPDSEQVQVALSRLGLGLRVQPGPGATLIATVSSPRGRVELR
jgi:hypothetical protein